MSNKSKSGTTATSSSTAATDSKPTAKPFQDDLQKAADAETEQGFRGTEVDPTPNEHYTVAGVTSGKPTPETHADAALAARNVTGIGLSGIEVSANEKAAVKGDKS